MAILNRRKFCECGCGTVIKRNKHFVHGHNSVKYGCWTSKSPPQLCLCDCGEMTKPGCQWIRGHWKRKNKHVSEETIAKISVALTGKKRTPESIEKQKKSSVGRKQTPESVEKRRQSMLGHVTTEETIAKISLALTGRKHSPERIEKNRQSHLGQKQSKESVEKRMLATANFRHTAEDIENMRELKILYYKDHPEFRIKASERMKNGNSPFYIDGRCSGEYRTYPVDFNERLKDLIRERDGFRCQLCSLPQEESKVKLSVHHIDYDRENCDPKNLITLCRPCHAKTNRNRDKWITFFQSSQRLTLVIGDS